MFKIDKNKKIIIYGAGEKGKIAGRSMHYAGLKVLYILDRDCRLWGREVILDTNTSCIICAPDKFNNEKNKEEIVIICTLENGLQHEAAASMLYKMGAKNIVFLPILHVGGSKEKYMLISVYNQIIRNNYQLNDNQKLPEYIELSSLYENNYCIYGDVYNEEKDVVSLELPIELLYFSQKRRKKLDRAKSHMLLLYENVNIVAIEYYYQMWNYLRTGKGNCDFYIHTQLPGSPDILLGAADRRRILHDRYKLLEIFDKEYACQDRHGFFLQVPAEGYYSPDAESTIILVDGYHRATYLISRGKTDIPVSLKKEDIKKLGSSKEVISKIFNSGIRYFIEHPVFYFYNQNCSMDIRKFLFCIQRHAKCISGRLGIVVAADGGYLLRNLLRAGIAFVSFFTLKKDIDWCKTVLDFFSFSHERYDVAALSDYSSKEFEFAVMDFTRIRSENIFEKLIKKSCLKTIYFRISESEWNGLNDFIKQKTTVLECYWLEDEMTISAMIEQ